MATAQPVQARKAEGAAGEDLEWLLQKKDHLQPSNDKPAVKNGHVSPPLPHVTHSEPTPPQSPVEPTAPVDVFPSNDLAPHEKPAPAAPPPKASAPTEPKSTAPSTPQPASQSHHPSPRPTLAPRGPSNDESKGAVKNLKKDGSGSGRRSSWISSLSSKFSSTTPQRSGSIESQTKNTPSPQPSPMLEFGNPFNKVPAKDTKDVKDTKKDVQEPPRPVITPRRQSVLVAAGKETKLEHPGFLSSALRRLSSSTNTTMGNQAGKGAICPRKIMNIDQNRERVKIQDFDQNKLRRVSFCVDVEIAGYAAQGDEESGLSVRPPVSDAGQRGSLSAPSGKSNTKDAKYKEKGEGAALKNPDAATAEKEDKGETKVDAAAVKAQEAAAKKENNTEIQEVEEEAKAETQVQPTTRKKEKKKRSEAERKERRERKRRHAEQNGLVPLEITLNSDDSDSNSNGTPGASTPKTGTSPTTDPLRIYKRCCQLRETTILSRVKEQISKPAALLNEAPGTVAVIDLSGLQMQLQDVTTFGDWLAVVPVRKLIMDNCNLSDEGLRVILSGLSGCKSPDQARANKKLPRRLSGGSGREQMGVIEKLSLKNNPNITSLGWKHLALFLHMSRSLKAIDLSGIPFPRTSDLSRSTTASSGENSVNTNGTNKSVDVANLVVRAIGERLGDKLEELILTGCDLTSFNIGDVVDCAIKCKIFRLGLANNALNKDAINHVVRYIKSGICEGLDLGNNNLHGICHLIADSVDENNPLFAISFSDCDLNSDDLCSILIPFQKLKNLKFIDLSHNKALFSGSNNAVPIFRKLLPKLTSLKRVHLTNCGLTSDHVIALSEILPDCPAMSHINLLENEALVSAMNSKQDSAQEEACAFFASLMTAARLSDTIVAIEIEVPSSESSEVVKALASQVVAYSLRNMERSTLNEIGVKSTSLPDKDTPEVLLHLVGHMDGYEENHDSDEPAPDEDYVIASSGIVKALGVCLGTGDGSSRTQSRNISPTASGTVTPKSGPFRPRTPKKPRDVSLELCEAARKIRMRLRPALIKQDKEGNDMEFRRLFFLDQTLQRMIQRFEDEYPETKVPAVAATSSPGSSDLTALGTNMADASIVSASNDLNTLSQVPSGEDYMNAEEANQDTHDANQESYDSKLTRTSSNTSLAAKAYTDEEGRMLRFGQGMRREVLRPTGMTDYIHGTSVDDDPEPEHLAALRKTLEEFEGSAIRERVEREGAEQVIKELGVNARELEMLRREDPEGFERFKGARFAIALNNGMGWDEAQRYVGNEPDARQKENGVDVGAKA